MFMKKKKLYILPRIYSIVVAQSILMVVAIVLIIIDNDILSSDLISQLLLLEIGLFMLVFYHIATKPMREMNKVFQVFAEGYTVQDIFMLRYGINSQHEAMLERLNTILDRRQILQASKKQAEYLALQNQINPHFLYNTLEGIRSEALAGGMNSVAEMTEALAKFFRYTISNIDTLVTVEDELDNVKNYCIIQQFRFDDKIKLFIECDKGDEPIINSIKIPKLILQPIVENAIRHGIEPLIGPGTILIRIQLVGSRLIIFISDNGIGMKREILDQLNNRLKGPEIDVEPHNEEGGIAMVNVNTRIKLIFGDEYGLYLYSTPDIGTDVEITLPAGEMVK